MINITSRTRITVDRFQREDFFIALERWIASRTGRDDGLNEWLGNSSADNGTAAAWADSWAHACELADDAYRA